MARSNGSAQTTGQGAAGWPPAEVDAHGRPIDPNARWAAPPAGPGHPQAPHPNHAYPPAYQHPPQGYPPAYAAEAGYHPGDAHGSAPGHAYAQPDPYTAPPTQPGAHYTQAAPGYPPAPAARSALPPHFEQFTPQPAAHPAQFDRYDQQLQVDPQAYAASGYQDPRHAGFAPAAHDPRGYEPAPQAGHADPQGWDLGQYPPAGQMAGQTGYAADPHGYAHQAAAQQQGHDQRWAAAPQGYAQPGALQHLEHGYAPAGRSPNGTYPGYAPQAGMADPAHQLGHDPQEDYVDEEPVETPRKGPRAVVVVGALIGAIALGGGLAYGYNKFLAGSKIAAKPPVVKASQTPTKTKPAEPGGKDVPHTGNKFLNRLAEEKQGPTAAPVTPVAPPAPTAEVDPNGPPRKVTTVIVNRDGSITPTSPAPAAPVTAAPAQPVARGPGIVIDGGPTPRPELRGPAAADPAPARPPAPPRVAELPLPKVAKADPPAAAAVVPPPKKKPAVRDDLVATQPGAATAAPRPAVASGANGYVAVLTSRKSREDALKSFADLHQKYAEALGSRVPDVREVDLGEKGTWYRLIVGPPGSKESAAALCKQLREQGFTGCFQMAY